MFQPAWEHKVIIYFELPSKNALIANVTSWERSFDGMVREFRTKSQAKCRRKMARKRQNENHLLSVRISPSGNFTQP
jgi:hypothetical protein